MSKFTVIRKLRKSGEKDCEKSAESLVDPNKFSTFAPALRDKRNKKEYTFVDILN